VEITCKIVRLIATMQQLSHNLDLSQCVRVRVRVCVCVCVYVCVHVRV
jgi:hypothetical protein